MDPNAIVEEPTGLSAKVASGVHTVTGFESVDPWKGTSKGARNVTAEEILGSSVTQSGGVPTAIDPVDQCQLESSQHVQTTRVVDL